MNIIITGASRGIGYELAKLFANSSSNKIIAIARSQSKLKKLEEECNKGGSGRVTGIVCDLNDAAMVSDLPTKIQNHFTSIDILINNAGAIVNKPFMELRKEDLDYVYNVNVFAVVSIIQKLLPMMNRDLRSHIVNISSMGGFQGSAKFAGLSAYSSSKAALACLTECLAEEFRDSNIAFNCLALGAAQTEMLEEAFPGYRAPLTAKQMAEYISEFSMHANKYLNGKVIPVSMSTP